MIGIHGNELAACLIVIHKELLSELDYHGPDF